MSFAFCLVLLAFCHTYFLLSSCFVLYACGHAFVHRRKGRVTEGHNKPTSEQKADRTTTSSSSGSSSPVVGHACNLGVPEIRSVIEIISRGNRVQVVKLVKHSRNLNILNSAVLIQVRVAAYGSPMDLCQLCRFEGQYFSL
jgi:hypothetical protein